ncbi:MAG: terminase gpA endonuclease subunit [Planctomycetota bacterium]
MRLVQLPRRPRPLADFPAAVYPLRCLGNNARRQTGQHIDGRPTYCTWAADKLVFPTVEGSACSGAVVTTTSLDANMRGQQHTTYDGRTLRPQLVLLDDPQTRQSARSPAQTRYRLQLLNGDVLGMAGPGESIAAVLTCTKIYDGDLADQILDVQAHPEWQGECTKLIYRFPSDEKLWDRYARIRAEGLRAGKGLAPATEFYLAHREAMDAGAVVAWPDRYDAKTEASALQHAMNLRLRDAEAFLAEYQNEPAAEQFDEDRLGPDDVASKTNGRPAGEVPAAATTITAFIDVHDNLLFYCVCAWEPDFTGYVLEYGTYPDQRRRTFTLRDATRTLGRAHPRAGREGAVQAGLEVLAGDLLSRPWKRTDGSILQADQLLVDSGYLPGVCNNVRLKLGGAMQLSKGVGIRAGNKPMSTYRRRPGERHGHHWYIPNTSRSREHRHVAYDTNYWKTFTHARLATAPGDPGCLSLYGDAPGEHRLFAEHVADAESWTATEGHGRTVHEWRLKATRTDNHWLDCLVGCAVAASMAGTQLGVELGHDRRRGRVRLSELQRQRR